MAKLLSMHPLIETHRAELLALARKRGVTGVQVFGLMSRDDGSDTSDVDLLVTLAPGTSALALGGLLLDAQELLGRRVDVVTEASLHHALRDRVMASAVPLCIQGPRRTGCCWRTYTMAWTGSSGTPAPNAPASTPCAWCKTQ